MTRWKIDRIWDENGRGMYLLETMIGRQESEDGKRIPLPPAKTQIYLLAPGRERPD